jgi:hypothetical protein
MISFRGRRRSALAAMASGLLVLAGVTGVDGASAAPAPDEGGFEVEAGDYYFKGVPTRVKAFNGQTPVTLNNVSTTGESHEILFVRLKDEKQNKNLNLQRAKGELAEHYNFETQPDPHNVGGNTPGFSRLVPTNPLSLRDATMGGRAEVFRESFGPGSNSHEVEVVPAGVSESNGIDFSRPGRYLYLCPITALALNDPHQEPHYLQDPGQIGFLEVVS